MIAQLVKKILHKKGYVITLAPELPEYAKNIPDASFYTPLFSPWRGFGPFKKHLDVASKDTLVSADRCYVLYSLASQALHVEGEFWECGVYRGGTAHLLADVISSSGREKTLRLFDTF